MTSRSAASGLSDNVYFRRSNVSSRFASTAIVLGGPGFDDGVDSKTLTSSRAWTDRLSRSLRSPASVGGSSGLCLRM